MTLTDILPAVRQLAAAEKLRLIRILAEDLDSTVDVSSLNFHRIYDLPTPYDTFGVGRLLMDAMTAADRACE